MSYNDAYYKWYTANIEPDKTIIQIIRGIMYSNDQGLPVIINRNPSISRGSLLQMYCVDMTFNYTMALPLQILPLLAADFDKLYILSHIIKILYENFFNCWELLKLNQLQRNL